MTNEIQNTARHHISAQAQAALAAMKPAPVIAPIDKPADGTEEPLVMSPPMQIAFSARGKGRKSHGKAFVRD